MTSTTPLTIMIPANTIIVKGVPTVNFNNNVKSRDEARLQILRKHKKEILEKVKFCDVSQTLIACGLVSKEECFEICKLPAAQQMLLCFQKVHDIMDILICQKSNYKKVEDEPTTSQLEKQSELVKDIWLNFLKAVKHEHPHLAGKLEGELEKLSDNDAKTKRKLSTGASSKLRKEDIGAPISFHHVQHAGLISRTKSADTVSESGKEKRIQRQQSDSTMQESTSEREILKEFFKRAGVESRHLTNPITRKIIYKFIEEHGGMEAIRHEICARPKSSSSENNLTKIKEVREIYGSPKPLQRENSGPPTKPSDPNQSNVSAQSHTTIPFQPTPKPSLFYF